MASEEIVSIDGGAMEGGGQILRMSLALSALQQIPIRVFNIRAGRRNPGLQAQHLTGLNLVAEICGAKVTGASKGSTEIYFYPSRIASGHFMADAQTAGSVGLLLQVSLPLVVFAEQGCTLTLKGGTNADMAPQIDYTDLVLRPLLKMFGVDFQVEIVRRGFFPKGGGIVRVHTRSTTQLNSVDLVDAGDVMEIKGEAFVAGTLPARCANDIIQGAQATLNCAMVGNIPMKFSSKKYHQEQAIGNGSGINLLATTSNGCYLGGSGLGKRNFPMADLGKKAADELLNAIDCKACVDEYAQDQATFNCIKDGNTGAYILECQGIGFNTRTGASR